jgi:phytoene dehydrogenase-like protein
VTESSGAVSGVATASGEHVPADVVVANVDADHLYRDLLVDERALARVRRAKPSTSAVVVLAAVDGRTEGLAHHNVWFSPDGATEFAQLTREGRMPEEPTIYAAVPCVTNPTAAPVGSEAWSILVNAPAGWQGDAERERDRVLGRLADRGVDLRDRLRFAEVITPADLAARYRSRGGAIYGTSSNGRRAAFLRPGNRGPRRGLYLVGGSSHPGGGLPLVMFSARIVADLVEADRW